MNLPALKEIIEERKEKAIEDLSASFAKNRLPLEEYERLVEYIHKIESERELIVVEKIVAEHSGNNRAKKYAHDDDFNESDFDDDNEELENSSRLLKSNLAIFSSRTVSGPIKSGTCLVSIFGSGHVRIRKADLKKQRTVLEVVSIFGENVISVEPGIRVTNKAVPILGSAETSRKVDKEALDEWPELVVSGISLFGSIEVKLLKR